MHGPSLRMKKKNESIPHPGGSLSIARSAMAKFSSVEMETAGYFSKEANEPAC